MARCNIPQSVTNRALEGVHLGVHPPGAGRPLKVQGPSPPARYLMDTYDDST